MLPRSPRPAGPTTTVAIATTMIALAGCASFGHIAAPSATPSASATTGPPPGASQAPGPPVATASPGPAGVVNPRSPESVAAACFVRWQSFDARTDDSVAGLRRARPCMTSDFYVSLGGGATQPASLGWTNLAARGTRSTVVVLAVSPLGPDTSATGRVALLLNARRTTTATGAAPIVSVTTPALTLVRQTDGTWLVAGADLSNTYGQAPGK